MKNLTTTKLLLILFLIKGTLWVLTVPLWQVPDEPEHFSRIQLAVLDKKLFIAQNEPGLSEELLESLKLLEIDKFKWDTADSFGKHIIRYNEKEVGIYEETLRTIPIQKRHQYVLPTSAWALPPLYYVIASPFFFIGKNSDLLTLVYLIRLFSIVLSVVFVWLALESYKIIYPKKISTSLALVSVVGFQPMVSYLFTGITPDGLLIVFGGLFFYLMLKWTQSNFAFNKWFYLACLTAVSGCFIKPNFAFSLLLLFVSYWIYGKTGKILKVLVTALIMVALFGISSFVSPHNYFTQIADFVFFKSVYNLPLLFDYFLQSWSYWREKILPSFIGVFGWEDTALPGIIYSFCFYSFLLSTFVWLSRILVWIKNRRRSKINPYTLVAGISVGLIILTAIGFDVWNYHRNGNLGIRGRYLLTGLVPLVYLWWEGFRWWLEKVAKKVGLTLIVFLSMGLNIFSLAVIVHRFYRPESFFALISRMSQYKPDILKGGPLCIAVLVYLAALALFYFKFITLYNYENNRRKHGKPI